MSTIYAESGQGAEFADAPLSTCLSEPLLYRVYPFGAILASEVLQRIALPTAFQRTGISVFSGRRRHRSAGKGRPASKDIMSSNGIV